MDGATVIGGLQVALLAGIFFRFGTLETLVKDHGRRLSLLERWKGKDNGKAAGSS